MGCGGSTNGGKKYDSIQTFFSYTNIRDIDAFFDKAGTVLRRVEEMRVGLVDRPESAKIHTGCFQLEEYSYLEVVRVTFWSLSTGAKGKIADTKLQIYPNMPYIDVDASATYPLTARLVDNIRNFIDCSTRAATDLPQITADIEKLGKETEELLSKVPELVENSGLNIIKKTMAGTTATKNLKSLAQQVQKAQKLIAFIPTCVETSKQVVSSLKQFYDAADEVGKQASAQGLYTPLEIFNKFHTGKRI